MKPALSFMLLLLIAVFIAPFSAITSPAQAAVSTEVSGILWDNTTWTVANRPYVVTDLVQVPANVTLTIEPGVTVNSAKKTFGGYLFLLNGQILANGDQDSPIIFNVNNSGLVSATNSVADSFLKLDYCVVNNASYVWNRSSGAGYGYFNITHSVIHNSEMSFFDIDSSAKDIYIEYNSFVNTSLNIQSDAAVYVRHNLFNGRTGLGFVIRNDDNGQNLFVEYNTFFNLNGVVVLSLQWSDSPSSGMNAPNNYWGTTDLGVIKSMVYDNSTDITCKNAITYLPILQEPDPETPTPIIEPTPTPTPAPSLPEETPVVTQTPQQTTTPANTPFPTQTLTNTPFTEKPSTQNTNQTSGQTLTLVIAVGVIIVICAIFGVGKLKSKKAQP